MSDLLTLHARDLIQHAPGTSLKYAPMLFDDYLMRTEGFRHVEAHVWRRRIANPIIEHLLLPTIAMDVTVRHPQRNTASLITITHVHSQPIPEIGMLEAQRLLAPYSVSVPFARAKDLWSWLASLVREGLSPEHATLALTSGFTPDEIRARWNTGTLDLDALRTLRALAA